MATIKTGKLNPGSLLPFVSQLLSADRCTVAYSGGVDSHVLLHLLAAVLPKEKLSALHINHQLSPQASHWAEHCQEVCLQLQVACKVETVEVKKHNQGLEAAARDARYQVFEQALSSNDLLLMAHHGDDQVETMLYRLLRGGLSVMPALRPLGQGRLIRPLLGYSQASVTQYALDNNLQWVEDESNSDTGFDRNFLRKKIVPLLKARWPDYLARLLHSAERLSDTEQLSQILAKQDFNTLDERAERQGFSIDIKALVQLVEIRQANALRYWFSKHRFLAPTKKMLGAVLSDLLDAKRDATPLVQCSDTQVRRFQDRVYLAPLPDMNTDLVTTPFKQPSVQLADGGILESTACTGKGLRYLPGDIIEIRFRQGGERCKPAQRNGSNSLKQLFQEYAIEPWLRQFVPLIYLNDQLAAVADLWVCDGFVAKNNEPGLVFKWQYLPQIID